MTEELQPGTLNNKGRTYYFNFNSDYKEMLDSIKSWRNVVVIDVNRH